MKHPTYPLEWKECNCSVCCVHNDKEMMAKSSSSTRTQASHPFLLTIMITKKAASIAIGCITFHGLLAGDPSATPLCFFPLSLVTAVHARLKLRRNQASFLSLQNIQLKTTRGQTEFLKYMTVLGWGLETTHSLNHKKEVHTQSRNQGIFLHFRQIFVNCGPMHLKLVAMLTGRILILIFLNFLWCHVPFTPLTGTWHKAQFEKFLDGTQTYEHSCRAHQECVRLAKSLTKKINLSSRSL